MKLLKYINSNSGKIIYINVATYILKLRFFNVYSHDKIQGTAVKWSTLILCIIYEFWCQKPINLSLWNCEVLKLLGCNSYSTFFILSLAGLTELHHVYNPFSSWYLEYFLCKVLKNNFFRSLIVTQQVCF